MTSFEPYLPVDYTMGTTFPAEYGKDVLQQISVIEEKWKRFYPVINYYCLSKRVTVIQDGNVDNPVGESGTTAFDPLWGEDVDPVMFTEGWKQPHLDETDTAAAANTRFYMDPVPVHAQVRREAHDIELKKLGFDRVRDLLVTIPVSLLDKAGIRVEPGDRFIWDNDVYEVQQRERTGFWKNTSLRIYIVLNCEHARLGS